MESTAPEPQEIPPMVKKKMLQINIKITRILKSNDNLQNFQLVYFLKNIHSPRLIQCQNRF